VIFSHFPKTVRYLALIGVVPALATCASSVAQVQVESLPEDPSQTAQRTNAQGGTWLSMAEIAPRTVREWPTEANDLDGDLRTAESSHREDRKVLDEGLHPLVMPLGEQPYPRLASHAKGSISVGTVTAGFLVQAAEIPLEGQHHRVLVKVSDRQTRFTTDEMRDLLMCAAKSVDRETRGQKLGIGNLSRQGGGPLPWSVSHNNGRDGDLAFYSRTPTGAIAMPEHLYHFGRDLQAADSPAPMHFDAAANWYLVKALLSCPNRPDIQHLFIASWLREAVLRYAKDKKEPKELIAQAANVLAQPHGALPHDDHLHIRIGCSADDQTEGCLDASRAPLDAVGRAPGVIARLGALRQALRSARADVRAGAVRLLTLYRDEPSAAHIAKMLGDVDAIVRKAAVDSLAQWKPTGAVDALDRALDHEVDPAVALAELRALIALDGTAQLIARLQDFRVLESDRFDAPTIVIRRSAAELLADSGSFVVARAVLPLLTDDRMDVRDTARETLGRITNRTTADLLAEPDLLVGMGIESMADVAADNIGRDLERMAWQHFLTQMPDDASRDAVALSGLARRGIRVTSLDRSALPELVRALLLPAPYRDNASRWIERIAQQKPVIGRGARANPAQFWPGWLVAKHLVSATAVAGVSPAGGTGISADND
jgi:murein endopeptidase